MSRAAPITLTSPLPAGGFDEAFPPHLFVPEILRPCVFASPFFRFANPAETVRAHPEFTYTETLRMTNIEGLKKIERDIDPGALSFHFDLDFRQFESALLAGTNLRGKSALPATRTYFNAVINEVNEIEIFNICHAFTDAEKARGLDKFPKHPLPSSVKCFGNLITHHFCNMCWTYNKGNVVTNRYNPGMTFTRQRPLCCNNPDSACFEPAYFLDRRAESIAVKKAAAEKIKLDKAQDRLREEEQSIASAEALKLSLARQDFHFGLSTHHLSDPLDSAPPPGPYSETSSGGSGSHSRTSHRSNGSSSASDAATSRWSDRDFPRDFSSHPSGDSDTPYHRGKAPCDESQGRKYDHPGNNFNPSLTPYARVADRPDSRRPPVTPRGAKSGISGLHSRARSEPLITSGFGGRDPRFSAPPQDRDGRTYQHQQRADYRRAR